MASRCRRETTSQLLRGFVSVVIGILSIGISKADGLRQDSDSRQSEAARRLRLQVDRYIGQLKSESRQVRISSEQNLLKLGPAILPLLPPPDLISDVSTREAVRRIRLKLERRQATESVQPSRVTLKGRMPLGDLLRSIGSQTHNVLDFNAIPKTLLMTEHMVDFQKQTFWQAITDLESKTGLQTKLSPNGHALTFVKPTGNASKPILARDTNSAYRITVDSLEWKPLFGDDRNRLLRVRWSVTAEPRLRPLFLKYTGGSLSATSKQGTVLKPFSPEAKYELSAADASRPIERHADFLVPKAITLSEIHFRGQMKMLTAAGQERITFYKPVEAVGNAIRRGGVTVTLQSLRRRIIQKPTKSALLTVGIAVAYDSGGPAFESHRTWMFHNVAELTLPGGKRVSREPGFKTNLQRDGAVSVAYGFRLPTGDAKPTSFVYHAPTLLIDVPLKFSFPAIPIPKPERKSP